MIAKGGGGVGDFGAAIDALAAAAQEASVRSVSREYHDLFIGVGRGELVPFASYYLTGFLNEKPWLTFGPTCARSASSATRR